MFKEKKIPTIIGIIILIVGLAAGIFLVTQGQNIFLKASPEIIPQEIKITNISDNSLTISWTTSQSTSGFVKYGETATLSYTLADDRDQLSGQTGQYTTHYVTLVNLKPSTQYYYKIGSGGREFPIREKPDETRTAPVAQGLLPPSDVASGTVNKPDGTPAEGVIIYLSMANASPLSAITGSSGGWLIPLNTARTTDLNSFAGYDREAQVIDIQVEGGNLGHASAITTTKNDNPVPLITLGETQDFRYQTEEEEFIITPTPTETLLETTPSPTPPSGFSPEIEPTPTATPTGELSIINPEEEEDLNTLKPEFAGTGPAGKIISVTVESPAYTGTVKVNEDGTWSWTPPADLEPGTHTIKVSYGGQAISKTFTVLAAGDSELPSFTSTPSATLTPTLTPTPQPRTEVPSTEAGVPEPGYPVPTFIVFLIGSGLIFFGFVIKSFLFSS